MYTQSEEHTQVDIAISAMLQQSLPSPMIRSGDKRCEFFECPHHWFSFVSSGITVCRMLYCMHQIHLGTSSFPSPPHRIQDTTTFVGTNLKVMHCVSIWAVGTGEPKLAAPQLPRLGTLRESSHQRKGCYISHFHNHYISKNTSSLLVQSEIIIYIF